MAQLLLIDSDSCIKIKLFYFVVFHSSLISDSCKLFGPINYELTMLHTMADTMNQSWFHGDMTSTEAYAALRDKKPGSFLVRFSTSEPKFCVSMVVSKSNKQQLSLRPSTPDREPRRRESRRSKVAQVKTLLSVLFV